MSNKFIDPEKDKQLFLDKKIQPLTQREVSWLREYFSHLFEEMYVSSSDKILKRSLIKILSNKKNYKEIVETGLANMSLNLVPQEKFKWLEGNQRAQVFAIAILGRKTNVGMSYDVFSSDLMLNIYRAFDQKRVKNEHLILDDKIKKLDSIYSLWKRVLTLDNYSRWLEVGDIKKIEWAQNYLIKKNLYLKTGIDPLNNKDVRAVVLASIDIIDHNPIKNEYINSSDQSNYKKLFIIEMKGAWTSKKHRDSGKTKKPYHLPLTKQSKGRLEKMASVNGLSESAMLDILINSEYILKFLDIDGKELY